ncbi:TEA/ATTS domain family-domain-containing protein [Calycina marina]|uniref:TEA/ATTS domain family-domain-containing protein n=1 Tax=Calycina marina TaxID=1763456 RepID=A0A9P7YY56_9HELO|nr:TEA/ATTS domain family-domain-containing protein [Calycina marina]
MGIPHALPANHPSVDSNSRILQPLSDAAGNSQYSLASVSQYNDSKVLPIRTPRDMPGYTIPAGPQQHLHRQYHHVARSLELRRQNTRRARYAKYMRSSGRNPIFDSQQYMSYRNRQTKESSRSDEDSKWPDVLEDAFLDALCLLPIMGRRKFTIGGKPHGRNELIAEYLWIAYCSSLSPGVPADSTMRRTRKQVSSHLQVLKGFLKDHPQSGRLFPSRESKPKHGFENSIKGDACLLAIAEGRLPGKPYTNYDLTKVGRIAVRPVNFCLQVSDAMNDDGRVLHKYTQFIPMEVQAGSLESIHNWRHRFPQLARLYKLKDLNCEIIHVDATFDLMDRHPAGTYLKARTEISIPGNGLNGHVWKTTTTLDRPVELYRDPSTDPQVSTQENASQVISITEKETRVKLHFPPISWAHVFTRLAELEAQYQEQMLEECAYGDGNGVAITARDYLEQISMYQEAKSARDPDQPFTYRAIILWTFHQSVNGQRGETTWRYLSTNPPDLCIPGDMCMSPSPHSPNHYADDMNENLCSLLDNSPSLHQSSLIDQFVQGNFGPPAHGGLQLPSQSFDYGYNHGIQVDVGHGAQSMMNPQSALSGHNAETLGHLLAHGNGQLGDLNHDTSAWNMPTVESYEADASWPIYSMPPADHQEVDWIQQHPEQHWQKQDEPSQQQWKEEANMDVERDWDHLDESNEHTNWNSPHEGASHPVDHQYWNADTIVLSQQPDSGWDPAHDMSANQGWEMMSDAGHGSHDLSGTSSGSPRTLGQGQNEEQISDEKAAREEDLASKETWVDPEIHDEEVQVHGANDHDTLADTATIKIGHQHLGWVHGNENTDFDFEQVEQLKE